MLIVQAAPDSIGKRLITDTAIQRDEVFYQITDYDLALKRTFTSVQISSDISIEDYFLAHLNHSCNPNVIIDTVRLELRAVQDIAPHEELTFFYPSTEWKMAEPFSCMCDSPNCLGSISGAKDMTLDVLGNYFINRHIAVMALEHLLSSDRVQLSVAA
ncbi:MAG: SET domain-containing protein [Leptolyngbya sp. SIO1D8]|nr:SET domain-containing protein [Leptolyngbya sp. SIO1D8]